MLVNNDSLYSKFIRIQRELPEPIYLQISFQFINAIQRGFLPFGMKLKGTRLIAEDLKVHRKTIIAAFDELQTQGWIEVLPKKGTFISNPKQLKIISGNSTERNLAGFSFRKSFLLDTPFEKNELAYHFNDGQPDYRLIDLNELSRYYRSSLKRKQVMKRYSDFSSHQNNVFLKHLSYYLNITRSLKVSPEHISSAKNKEILLFSLVNQLILPKDLILVGALSHFSANMIFQQAGATIKTIPIDKDGLDVAYVRQHFQPNEIRCIYLNSQNHYPTTATLSLDRRKALIELANEFNFILIEDNDDVEFQYKNNLESLFNLDNHNRVIYLSTFGKYLPPAFQIGFMLAPKDFTVEIRKFLQVIEPQEDLVLEQILSEMIESGDSIRYFKKAIKSYKEKRDSFDSLLQKHLSEYITYSAPTGGLAFWINFNTTFSIHQLAKKCQANNLFLPRICIFQNREINAIRLGFGHLNMDEMKKVLQIFQKSVEEMMEEQLF
jgi:GntR family transcriptional regulator/MocR family aminotransferase